MEPYACYAKEIITVDGATTISTGLQPTSKPPVEEAVLTVDNAPIRFWVNGDTPTATQGHLLAPGDSVKLKGINDIRNFKAINVGSVATVQASFFN